MKNKNDIVEIEKILKNKKCVVMLAPSFVTNFEYPSIINQLKKLGFDKVVELTFGAKMVNREYHKKIRRTKTLLISSTCPGIVTYVKNNHPKFAKNLVRVDSPMVAMAKICRKHFPKHKIFFISPCAMKKTEANEHDEIDYVIDFVQLKDLFVKYNIEEDNTPVQFDKFYNDFTKIYPLSGALYETARIHKILKPKEAHIVDGISHISKFLEKPNKNTLFLDCLFCEGGCIGGPFTNRDLTVKEKKKKMKKYMQIAKVECMMEGRKGVVKEAKGIKFTY